MLYTAGPLAAIGALHSLQSPLSIVVSLHLIAKCHSNVHDPDDTNEGAVYDVLGSRALLG